MGWNAGWTILQEQVIEIYDQIGAEQFKKIAAPLITPFLETDMDEGGKNYDYCTKDGKEMEQVIVDALCKDFDAKQFDPCPYDGKEPEYDHEKYAYGQAFWGILTRQDWEKKL